MHAPELSLRIVAAGRNMVPVAGEITELPSYGGAVRSMDDTNVAGKPVVVQAITRLNIGGPARHVLDLAEGLSDRFLISVATGTSPALEGELSSDLTPVERLPMVRAIAPHLDATALIGMRRLLQAQRTDLVHSHMAKAGTIARVAAASMRPRPRTVHTFHGHVLSGYFSRRTEQVFAEIERRLANHTDVLVAVSEAIRDELLDLGIGTPSQFEVVPLGLRLEPYLAVSGRSGRLRRRLELDNDVPVVAVLARLAPIKDHRTLLDAMALVPDAHLVVLGDGELRSDLEEMARRVGIGERTHFLGWWADVAEALADSDAVALTSRNEGTPMALIEAGAAGRPVVATDVGGVRRVVVDGRTGVLAPAGDAAAVAGALRRLLADPQLRRRLGDEARRHVEREFGLQRFLDQTAGIYDGVLSGRVTDTP